MGRKESNQINKQTTTYPPKKGQLPMPLEVVRYLLILLAKYWRYILLF